MNDAKNLKVVVVLPLLVDGSRLDTYYIGYRKSGITDPKFLTLIPNESVFVLKYSIFTISGYDDEDVLTYKKQWTVIMNKGFPSGVISETTN